MIVSTLHIQAPLITSATDTEKKEHFASHRNDSYSQAMTTENEQVQVF